MFSSGNLARLGSLGNSSSELARSNAARLHHRVGSALRQRGNLDRWAWSAGNVQQWWVATFEPIEAARQNRQGIGHRKNRNSCGISRQLSAVRSYSCRLHRSI
eukprot:NODE_4701_length_648_cov_302.639123.p3 GENE.NODE_4701_length_648_cov_302.639123~~NODE_4701_length_648_cov_302.639123.p3  ORF type:complete len:103 (-),score=8.01 NODE_4701_length_648_cov_302.639123:102-410(-)